MDICNWLDLQFFKSGKFEKIVEFLATERKAGKSVLPEKQKIFNALATTSLDDVKVVILGQDPYPNKTHAMGLAFSVPDTVKPLPKSLQNIYEELRTDVNITRNNGDLSDWSRQGTLLLNTTLTVIEKQPNSHAEIGWKALTNEIIETLSNRKKHLVFILWGAHAQSLCRLIDTDKHHVITSPHPSPLSARRGFFGSKPFSRTNSYLSSNDIVPIRW